MALPPRDKTFQGLLKDHDFRIALVERRLGAGGASTPTVALPTRGSTALRDSVYGVPANDTERVALANELVFWFNTSTQKIETYYTLTSKPGLTVPGLASGFSSGWYGAPNTQWAGKSGPSSIAAAYKAGWARGITGAGSALDATSDPTGIKIGLTGIYECRSTMRGGPTGNARYHALALNGDRQAFENRSTVAPLVGVWTHDHPAATNNFTESDYLGTLYAGDFITAGPDVISTDLAVGIAASSGYMTVKRIA